MIDVLNNEHDHSSLQHHLCDNIQIWFLGGIRDMEISWRPWERLMVMTVEGELNLRPHH